MPAPTTIDAFFEIVRRSDQIEPARLDDYLAAQADALPGDVRRLALRLVRDGVLTAFQAEQFLQGKYKGFAIGNYRIIERLGTGGTGNVFLAEHQLMRRRVAIKVLPTALAEDRALVERFRREARAAAVLDHPNIIRIYDFREEAPVSYLVLEHIDGPNLHKVIARKGALPIPVACEYARQVARGLQHAHEQGLIHRDIKPANLLVDVVGVIKILDLGLVRFVSDEGSITREFNSSQVLGTADYLSPEQALDLHTVDARADLYSLGATLFALLTGRPPFDEGTLGQKLLWHQSRVPDRADALRPDVPAELADLVARLLEKSPADRPASAAEVADALAPWADLAPAPRPMTRSLPDMEVPPAADTVVARSKHDTTPMPAKERAPAARRADAPPPAWALTRWGMALIAGGSFLTALALAAAVRLWARG